MFCCAGQCVITTVSVGSVQGAFSVSTLAHPTHGTNQIPRQTLVRGTRSLTRTVKDCLRDQGAQSTVFSLLELASVSCDRFTMESTDPNIARPVGLL